MHRDSSPGWCSDLPATSVGIGLAGRWSLSLAAECLVSSSRLTTCTSMPRSRNAAAAQLCAVVNGAAATGSDMHKIKRGQTGNRDATHASLRASPRTLFLWAQAGCRRSSNTSRYPWSGDLATSVCPRPADRDEHCSDDRTGQCVNTAKGSPHAGALERQYSQVRGQGRPPRGSGASRDPDPRRRTFP